MFMFRRLFLIHVFEPHKWQYPSLTASEQLAALNTQAGSTAHPSLPPYTGSTACPFPTPSTRTLIRTRTRATLTCTRGESIQSNLFSSNKPLDQAKRGRLVMILGIGARCARTRVTLSSKCLAHHASQQTVAPGAAAAAAAGWPTGDARRFVSTRTATDTAAATAYPTTAAAAARSILEKQRNHRRGLVVEQPGVAGVPATEHGRQAEQDLPPPLSGRRRDTSARAGHQKEESASSDDVDDHDVASVMPKSVERHQRRNNQQQQHHQQQHNQHQHQHRVVSTGEGGGDLRLGEFMEEVKTELWQYDALPLRRRFRVQSLLRCVECVSAQRAAYV